MVDDLACRLATRLAQPLPGRIAQSKFEPELSFGRHYAPAPADARSAAVLALLYRQGATWYIPLTVRPETMADHAGQVSLPGGMVAPGEASHEAALRELEEELGIRPHGVELVGQLSPLYVFVSNFCVTPWVAVCGERPSFVPNPCEVAELLEVPLAYLLDVSNHGRHWRAFQGLSFSVPHIRWQSHYIWGATSMILAELIDLIGEVTNGAPVFR